MNRTFKHQSLLPFALLMASALPSANALAESYTIDPRHSRIEFVISHLGFSLMQGNFNDISGSYEYDPAKPGNSSISVTIKTGSVDTNDAERDKHIRSNDFLDAVKYPEAIFKSTGSTLDDKAGTLEGNLTLHGVTRPISIQVEAIGVGNDPWGGFRRGYVGHTAIKRSDFNMNYNLGPLADEVKLRLFVEGIKNK